MIKQKQCECEVCQYGRSVASELQKIPEESRKFFEDMYQKMAMAEDEVSYFKIIVEGKWPNARKILGYYWDELKDEKEASVAS